MFILAIVSLLATALAAPPIWFSGGKCGVSKYPDAGKMPIPASPGKIIGGIEARPHEFPWQVSKQLKYLDQHACGGSIINERWIVTAAHCMIEHPDPALWNFVVGEHTRGGKNAARQIIEAEAFFSHEQYSGKPYYLNDIALVKTKTPISFNENVQPICAPDPANLYAYRKSVVSGWGNTAAGILAPTLLYVSLNVTTNDECRSAYKPIHNAKITDDMICGVDHAGGHVGSTCQGDSGGPVVVKDASGTFTLIGAVSYGVGCAAGYPAVYARVGHQAAWISDKLAKNN